MITLSSGSYEPGLPGQLPLGFDMIKVLPRVLDTCMNGLTTRGPVLLRFRVQQHEKVRQRVQYNDDVGQSAYQLACTMYRAIICHDNNPATEIQ